MRHARAAPGLIPSLARKQKISGGDKNALILQIRVAPADLVAMLLSQAILERTEISSLMKDDAIGE